MAMAHLGSQVENGKGGHVRFSLESVHTEAFHLVFSVSVFPSQQLVLVSWTTGT